MNVNDVLNGLLRLIKIALHDDLIGMYLYGSMVHGDFDEELSDIDLLIVTKGAVDEVDVDQLNRAHEKFNALFPKWSDRIDLAYVSSGSLQSFKSKEYGALVIHGKQKLARISSEPHWLIDWYKVLNQGKVLYGPRPDVVIPDITKQEFRNTIKEYILGWPSETKSKNDPADLAYVVLALCRSMYAYTNYVNISKPKAAKWAENEFPQFADLIRKAALLSRAPDNPDEQNMIYQKEVLRFVEYICAKVS